MKTNLKSLLRLSIISLASVICHVSYGQGNNGQGQSNGQGNGLSKWNVNGNSADTTDFIGTINQRDLILKTNSEEALRLTSEQNARFFGDVYLDKEVDPTQTESKIVVVSSNGKLQSMNKSGLLGAFYGSTCGILGDDANGVLYQSPTWQSVPVSTSFGHLITGIDCPARVGIGIANPSVPLHVSGSGLFTGNIGIGDSPLANTQINVVTNRRHGIQVDHNYPVNNGYAIKANVNNITSRGLSVYNVNYNKDVFQVFGDGEVKVSNGVGDLLTLETTGKLTLLNGSEKLLLIEPDGLLRSRRIKVDVSYWADYVFDDNYILPTLSYVEAFVEKHGHLPDVPSEHDLIEDGLDLGEMNRTLMQKVEELTLYLIEQKKELDHQKTLIEELQEKIKEK